MPNEISTVIIDPRCRISYASYYVYGFIVLFGPQRVRFQCIPELDGIIGNGLATKLITPEGSKLLFFDYLDGDAINEKAYQQVDAYGKVNLKQEDAIREKVVSIGPSFGICLWNPITCLWMGLRNYRIIKKHVGKGTQSLKSFIRDYAYMFVRRKKYSYYHRFSDEEKRGYTFAMSTLWWGDLSINTTNKYRGSFMRLCKQLMDTFEGGFFYVESAEKESSQYPNYLKEFHDMIYRKRLSMTEYDKRNRQSWFVFNTPSVIGCHGWKLGEYLCEGKAIISTPLNNVVPGDFSDGVHYIKVTCEQDLKDAIIRLRDDEEFVNRLKRNAFKYFDEWVSPEVSVKLVMAKVGLTI